MNISLFCQVLDITDRTVKFLQIKEKKIFLVSVVTTQSERKPLQSFLTVYYYEQYGILRVELLQRS